MGWIVAVVFQRNGRLYYADPDFADPDSADPNYADPGPADPGPAHPGQGEPGQGEPGLRVGDQVLYPTDSGPEVAEVVWAPQYSTADIAGLPVLVGRAGAADLARAAGSRRKRAAAQVAARRLIREHGLPMKVSGTDYVAEGNRATIYFTAPERVDFRALVRDLAATLKCRVELRQLSARDEARLLGGIGSCGRELCCATFLVDFEPVSVRMAKAQGLPLNPMRISGACGKLMCCLKYEHPMYQDFARAAPALGGPVETPSGPGTVVGHDVPGQRVAVRMAADGRIERCALASVCASRQAHEQS